jgi:type IV pilus assembly protein PilE
VVTAAPSGDQVKDKCGTMTVDQAGAKTAASTCPAGGW